MTSSFPSRNYFTLEFIPFVTSTQELKNTDANFKDTSSVSSHFSGKEACEFYKNVLETPSTSISKSCPNKSASDKINIKLNTSKTLVKTYDSKHIHKYAQDGDRVALRECLKENIDLLNQQDMYGWTPLMCCVCECHFKCTKLLLELGADINVKNNCDMTALDIAMSKTYVDIIDILKNGVKYISETSQVVEHPEIETYCTDCKLSYKESKINHERSIAHLFSTKKADPTTFYHIPEHNKGFQIMVKSGWDQNKGLGSKEEGRKFPIKTILKKDRSCIGRTKETARVTHFDANDCSAIKRVCNPAVKIVREKTLKKWQRVKLERKNRQKEMEYRRQFNCDY